MAIRCRDWVDARAKVAREGACRVCRDPAPQVAHIVGRTHDRPHPTRANVLWVDPEDVLPLCPACHGAYDARRLDIVPHLTRSEQARAVELLGLVGALRRLSGRRAA